MPDLLCLAPHQPPTPASPSSEPGFLSGVSSFYFTSAVLAALSALAFLAVFLLDAPVAATALASGAAVGDAYSAFHATVAWHARATAHVGDRGLKQLVRAARRSPLLRPLFGESRRPAAPPQAGGTPAPPYVYDYAAETYDGLVCQPFSSCPAAFNPGAKCGAFYPPLEAPHLAVCLNGSGAVLCNTWRRGRFLPLAEGSVASVLADTWVGRVAMDAVDELVPNTQGLGPGGAAINATGLPPESPAAAPPLPPLPTCTDGVDCFDGSPVGGNFSDDFMTWRPAPGTVFGELSRLAVLRCFAGKRVTFVGDSMMRQVYTRLIMYLRGRQEVVIEHFYHASGYYAMDRLSDVFYVHHREELARPAGTPPPDAVELTYLFQGSTVATRFVLGAHRPDIIVQMGTVDGIFNDAANIVARVLDFLGLDGATSSSWEWGGALDRRQYVYLTQPLGTGFFQDGRKSARPIAFLEKHLAEHPCAPVVNDGYGAGRCGERVCAGFASEQFGGDCPHHYRDELLHERNMRMREAVRGWQAAQRERDARGAGGRQEVVVPPGTRSDTADQEASVLGPGPRARVALLDYAAWWDVFGGRAPYLRNAADAIHFQCGWNRIVMPQVPDNELSDQKKKIMDTYDYLCWKVREEGRGGERRGGDTKRRERRGAYPLARSLGPAPICMLISRRLF